MGKRSRTPKEKIVTVHSDVDESDSDASIGDLVETYNKSKRAKTRYSRMLTASSGNVEEDDDSDDDQDDDEDQSDSDEQDNDLEEEQDEEDEEDDDEEEDDDDDEEEGIEEEEEEDEGGPLVYSCDICPEKVLKTVEQVEVHLKSKVSYIKTIKGSDIYRVG